MASERETITVDLDTEVLWRLFHMAHERDITLNALMEEILLEAVRAAGVEVPE